MLSVSIDAHASYINYEYSLITEILLRSVECGAGEESNPTNDVCEPCAPTFIKIPTALPIDPCTECAPGRHANSLRTQCLCESACACASSQLVVYRSCTLSRAGVYDELARCVSVNSDPGSFATATGAVQCDAGTYSDQPDQEACTSCPPGTGTAASGADSQTLCIS